MADYQFEMSIDFGEVGYWSSVHPFKVTLDASPLHRLISDATNAYRVYELMLIKRPGDVWDYVMVKPEDVPERLARRIASVREEAQDKYAQYHSWPMGKMPFANFDRMFYWAYDDTEPEDEAWLSHRNSPVMKAFSTQLFAAVNSAKATLSWNDPLLRHVLRLIDTGNHGFDHLSRTEALAAEASCGPSSDTHTKDFYKKLEDLLDDPELVSVAYRADGDYRVQKILATQQRKRSNKTKHHGGDSLYISALTNKSICNKSWDSEINFYSEGLGHGDLYIQGPGLGGNSIKALIEDFHRAAPGRHILSYRDEGDIKGYAKESGDGWWLYIKQPQDSRRENLLRIYYDRLFGRRTPMLAFNNDGGVLYSHEKVLIVLGSDVPIDSSMAISEVLADWPHADSTPLVISIGGASAISNGMTIPVFAPANSDVSEGELQAWLRSLIFNRLPWIDAVLLIDCPSWAANEIIEVISRQDNPWRPWVISNTQSPVKSDLLLSGPVSTQIQDAHRKAKTMRSRTY